MTRGGKPPAQFQDADELADAIIERVGKNIVLALPLGLGKANHVANALFARAAADPSITLRIFTALTLEKPRPRSELERRFVGAARRSALFGGYPELAYAMALHERRLPPNVEVDEFFFQAGTRLGVPAAQQSYISANYTHALRYVLERGVNVVAQLVAKRARRRDALQPELQSRHHARSAGAARAGRRAISVRRPGQFRAAVHARRRRHCRPSELEFMLDSRRRTFPLFAPPREPVDLAEYAAGLHAARHRGRRRHLAARHRHRSATRWRRR